MLKVMRLGLVNFWFWELEATIILMILAWKLTNSTVSTILIHFHPTHITKEEQYNMLNWLSDLPFTPVSHTPIFKVHFYSYDNIVGTWSGWRAGSSVWSLDKFPTLLISGNWGHWFIEKFIFGYAHITRECNRAYSFEHIALLHNSWIESQGYLLIYETLF